MLTDYKRNKELNKLERHNFPKIVQKMVMGTLSSALYLLANFNAEYGK